MSIKKVPKTLILIPHLDVPGGVSHYYKTLMLDTDCNIKHFVINGSRPQSVPSATLRLLIKYFQFVYTVIIFRYKTILLNPSLDEGKSFYRDLIFILITNMLKRKCIVFFRGWYEPFEERIKTSKFKTLLFNISYAKADTFIVLGEIFKKKLLALGVPIQTKFFIETTVADSSYLSGFDLSKKYSSFQDELIFLFLSRIEKEKGIYIAIDAFNEFSIQHPKRKSSLIIAGDGRDLAAVKEYAIKREIANITFMGHVSLKQKEKVLLEGHIMLFPSFTEGLPNVILEGMLYGMPIISRSTGGIPEIINHNINGYITESYDFSVFVPFLTNLAFDDGLYRKMAETNHRTALAKFTSAKVKERIMNIL